MTKTILLATTAILLTASAAAAAPDTAPQVAQRPVPTAPGQTAPLTDAAQQGVLVFTPDFFADQRPNTALDMVNRIPGFSVQDGSGSRGFEGAVGNILINNARPASKTDTGSNVLSRTTAAQVERIELIRGGAPGIDMQGYSVIANVILKSGASRQTILEANAVLFDGGHDIYGGRIQFTETRGDRTWGVILSDGQGMSDSNGVGRITRYDAAGNLTRDEQFFNDSYGGGQGLRGNYSGPLFGGKIDVTGRIGNNDYHSIQLQTSPTVLRDSRYENDGKNGELGVVFTRPLNSRWTLETRLIHQMEDYTDLSISNTRIGAVSDPEQVFTSDSKTSESILRGLVRNERSTALTFEAGGEVAYNMLETTQAFTVGGVGVPLPSASVKVEETRGETFGKATWRVRPNLTIEGGLRLEASTIKQSGDAELEKSFFFAKPRLLATWTPRANNQLRFRFERELGQLDFGDFAASAELSDGQVYGGNVDLEPEQRWISELTYERRFWGEGIVSVGYRHDEIIDVIDRLPLPGGLSATGNIGDGTLDQLALNVVVPLTRLHVPGGRFAFKNSWNKTEVTDPTTGQTRPISGVRPTQAVISFQQDLPAHKLQWGVNYIPLLGQASFDPDQKFSWRGSEYFEAWAEIKPTATLSFRAQINLWNDFNPERVVYADRVAQTVAFVEYRDIDPRTFVSLKMRKTF